MYVRRGSIYLTAKLQTEAGLWLQDGPCTRLPSDTSDDSLGRAVLERLAHSGQIIPHPTEWGSPDEDNSILEAANIKRWNTFRKGARYVAIGLYGDEFILSPTENEGKDGFGYLPDELRLPATISPAELGQAVKRVLAMCK